MDILPVDWLVLVTFVVALVTSIVSGLGGGGAGFILTPYYIMIGLTPQEAVATGKMGGMGISVGSIMAFKGKGLINKKYIWPFLIITTVCAFISAWLIPQIDGAIFQTIIAWTLLLLWPTLFINKGMLRAGDRARGFIVFGFILYTVISFAQTMVGAGIGTLLVLVMMFLFGMNALEANATKRTAQVVQAVIIFVLLLIQGLVVVAHGIAAMLGSAIGGNIGSRMAIKKGETFVKIVLALIMVTSGLALLFIK